MTLQLSRPAAGLEMPDLVLSILAATLTGDENHVQVP